MKPLHIALALTLLCPPFVFAQSKAEKEQIKTWALEAILENPEIIMQAMRILDERQKQSQAEDRKKLIKDNYELISADPNAPIMGNPDGDVTVVEFFDYNSSYCRKGFKNLQTLVKKDPNVKILFREFPILSEGSEFAARASLGADKQGKYIEFHSALMGDDISAYAIDEDIVMDVARRIGLDIDLLRADMNSESTQNHITTSQELARALHFNGTPAFIIGSEPVSGLLPVDKLMELVAQARAQN